MPLQALITGEIAPQNFEIIRDQIGGILLVELLNQYTLNQNPALLPTGVYIERFVPIDDSEFPAIIVSLGSGRYDSKDYDGNVVGDYSYYIDIYTGSTSTDTEGGDKLATLALEKLMGMCRAILDNPLYCTLGFDPQTSGLQIQNVSVVDFTINQPTVGKRVMNVSDYVCGSMRFTVRVPETVELLDTVIVGAETVTVGLFESDRFYVWKPISQTSQSGMFVSEDGLQFLISEGGDNLITEN